MNLDNNIGFEEEKDTHDTLVSSAFENENVSGSILIAELTQAPSENEEEDDGHSISLLERDPKPIP